MKSLRTSLALAVWCVGIIGCESPARSQEDGPKLVRTEAVIYPAYESYRNIESLAPTREEYQRAVSDRRFIMQRLTYRSDGLEVYAYLYRPRRLPSGGEKLPVVVFNRGSYTREDFSPEVLMPGRRLAQEGYLVVAPMLRGSGGAAGRDELGGADLQDVFNIVPVLGELGYADINRLFLYGESRGGIQSLLAAKHGFPARAVATWGAITDLGEYLRENPRVRDLSGDIWPGFPANEAEVFESRSALYWPEQIKLPVLLMNGGGDTDVRPRHAIQLGLALDELGAPYELKIFHDEGHLATARAAERESDAVRWFRRFDAPLASGSD